MGFQDESGISDKPSVRVTWALRGKTPHITSSGGWRKLTLSGIIITNAGGMRSRLFLRILPDNMNGGAFITFLKELKGHMNRRKLLLFIDGLAAPRSQIVSTHLRQEKHWLRVERFPSYAPELNPIEYLWGTMKKKHLGNARTKGLDQLAHMVKKAKRKMNDRTLLHGFLKASGLY